MADSREFVLIGSFTDNITPSLEKINLSITKLKNNLAELSSVAKPLKNDFRDLASLSRDFNSSLKTQGTDIREMTAALKAFRSEMGRVNRAYRGGGNRLMRQVAGAGAQRRPSPPRPPSIPRVPNVSSPYQDRGNYGGGGGGGNGPRPPGGGGNRGGYGGGYAGAVGGGIIGNQLADIMTNSIVQGFRLGTRIMEAPFKYFQNALGERINDEMSDLKAAGGMYAIAKRQKDPFVKTMDEAIQFTQANNLVLTKLAGDLPGSTQDYVEVSKRISDTVTRVVGNNLPAAIKMANEVRATGDNAKYYGGQIKGTGPDAFKEATTTLMGEITKKTVLAGFGGRAGAGGATGAYGLPGLSERMISQDKVSMGQFQRYSAIFSDPQIMDALQRNIGKINATTKDSAERLAIVNKFYDEVLPPELIEKFRRSVKGINEAIVSATVNPENGLLGIGRKMQGLGRVMNDFGQYVDKTGKVVTDVNDAAQANLSIYDMLRDIYAQTAQVLVPILQVLPEIWDPLKRIGEALEDARHYTGQFLQSFIGYKNGLKAYAKTLGGADKDKLMMGVDIRSSLLAISNLFKQLKVIDSGEFANLYDQLIDPNADIGKILQSLVDKLFNSKVAEQIGEFLGKLIGTVLRQVADATNYIANAVEGGGFAGGFSKAFKDAGGFSGIQDIFVNIVKLFVKAIGTAITEMPLLSGLAVAFALIPGMIGAAITAMVERSVNSFQTISPEGNFSRKKPTRLSAQPPTGPRAMRPVPGSGGLRYESYNPVTPGAGRRGRRGGGGYDGGFLGEQRSMRAARLRKMRQARDLGRGAQSAVDPFMNYAKTSGVGQGFAKAGREIGKIGKFVPGGAAVAGAVDMSVALASGENFGKAAAGALGTVIGGAAGSIFGPAGTVIGSIAGGMIGDVAADLIAGAFTGPSDAQREAAKAQMFAAQAMKGVPTVGGKEVGPGGEFAGTGIVGISQLFKAFKFAGLEGDKSAQSYLTAANNMANLRTEYQKLNDLAAAQKAASGGRVNTTLQAKLDASRETLAAAEAKTAAAWNKITATNKTKIDNAIVQMQTNTTKFNQALTVQAMNVAQQMQNATNIINAAKLTPDAVKKLSDILPPDPTGTTSEAGRPRTKADIVAGRYKGGLGDAISKEMRMKPPGSGLVIANSSETVIPAAGGYGMKDFMGYLRSGFDQMATVIPRAVRMGSVGNNPYGGSGGGSIGNINVTVNAGSTTDPDALASIVAMKIGEAVADARAASVFV